MALYRCEACNEDRRDPICEKCGRETREIALPAVTLEGVAASIARDTATPTPKPSLPEAAPPLRVVRSRDEEPVRDRVERPRRVVDASQRLEDPKPAPRTPPPAAPSITGLVEFEALLNERKMEAVVICGDSQTGKSEIAAGFTRARAVYRGKAQLLTLRAPDRNQYVLSGTNETEVWYQIVDDKHVFLDPSGEFFKKLSPQERLKHRLPDVTEQQFDFVKSAVAHLAGIVLVVDLTRTLGDDYTAWKRQEDDLNFVLAALRMLRFDKTARPAQITMTVNIAQRVSSLRRIDKPVLVLFSKADQLTHLTNSSPLEFAKANLPLLHGALLTHARHFRYDFCHTMIKTAHGDRAAEHPCGVLLSMEWLLRNPFHRLRFQLPTKLLGGGR